MSAPGTDCLAWPWLRGRARRREFWLWTVVVVGWNYVFVLADDPAPQSVLGAAFWFQVVRRLHDVGCGATWIAGFVLAQVALLGLGAATQPWGLLLMPLTMVAALLVLGLVPGQREANRFGPPPGEQQTRTVRA